MNIVQDFVDYMEDEGFGTLGTDLFVGGAPLESPDTCWWALSNGGSPTINAESGERLKSYSLLIYYRSMDGQDVYDTLQEFEEAMNTKECITLTNYELTNIACQLLSIDQDLDQEDRTIGLLEIVLTIYQS